LLGHAINVQGMALRPTKRKRKRSASRPHFSLSFLNWPKTERSSHKSVTKGESWARSVKDNKRKMMALRLAGFLFFISS
jgi:hypothetical protein